MYNLILKIFPFVHIHNMIYLSIKTAKNYVIQGWNSIEKKYYARYASYWAKCQLTKMYVNLAKIGLSPSEYYSEYVPH